MENTVLILKTVPDDMTAYNQFVWPTEGPVTADRWNPEPVCGDGLHGLLWGCGNARDLIHLDDRWIVFSALAADVVDLGGKVKVPAGTVVHVGDKSSALAYLDAHGAADKPVVYAQRTAGDDGRATAGDYGRATAGDRGTLVIKWYDIEAGRYRLTVGYVGEDGIEPNVAYRCDKAGKLVTK